MEQLIPRRAFLQLMIVAAGLVGLRNWSLGKKIKLNQAFTFYVAGVRFSSLSERLNVGSYVRIVPEMWKQEQCYAIHSDAGQRIGYVPRKVISTVEALVSPKWIITEVNRNALPWKRYKIALSG